MKKSAFSLFYSLSFGVGWGFVLFAIRFCWLSFVRACFWLLGIKSAQARNPSRVL